MSLVLRVATVVLVVSGVSVLVGLFLGQIIETEVVTDYYTLEDKTYNLEIRDSQRGFHQRLGGTRCYEPLPPWAESKNDMPANYIEGQFSQIRFRQAQDAVKQITCFPQPS